MAKEAWYINESELDDYQVPIIQKKMNSSFVVKGCAGSGKTVLALWKAREINDANLGSYYVIVYTKALRQFINDGINEIGLSQSRVVHFNQWKNRLNMPQADFVIIDEVQDFTKEELDLLQKSAGKAFILFGDTAQQIYKGLKPNLMTMEQIAFHTQLAMESLVLNHRLPKKIGRVAEYLNSTGDSIEGRCTKEGANKPFLVKTSSWKEQLDFIKDTIEERGYTDVGILFPQNTDVKKADEYFKSIGFGVESKYDINYPDNVKFNLNFHSDNPKIMTYHSSKGLQFEAVFIPTIEVKALTGETENPLYVALTRTYQDLFIIKNGDEFGKIPISLFEVVDLNNSNTDLPF
ncbi:3'-5' exonuclease [Flavobacterium sp.]|uniref:3'-5' exonuclease n=1 Tax=Flavobacterium sp. TaxID=239 RepID=UPI003F69F582